MKRFLLLALLAVSLAAHGQYSRGDFSLTTATGQSVSGASVYVLQQPASTTSFTPTISLFGSPTGSGTAVCGGSAGTISNPLKTDQFGHACAYFPAGTYTVCYVSPLVGTQCYLDQTYGSGGSGGGGFPTVFDVRTYGAKVDGSTDDTAAVQAAVAAAAAASGGGVVFVPSGTMITQPIQGVSNVGFLGQGNQQTTWKLISGATPVAPSGSGTCSTTASVIIECYTSGWSISSMTIDGNQSGQSGTTSYGIYVSANGYTPTSKTPPSMTGVTVQFTKSDGIHIDFGSAGQGLYSHITVYGAAGIGIFAGSYDTQWTDLNIGQSGLQGLYMAVSAQHFTSVKSWFSGSVTPASGTGILSVAGNNQCDSCEAQDNQAYGIFLDGATGNVFTGVVSSGNNRTSVTTGVGVEFANATDNVVIGNAQGGADFSPSQLYAVEFNGSSANNHVRLTSSGNVTGLIHGTSTNEDVLVVDSSGTIQSQFLGSNMNLTGPIVSSAYIGSVSPSTTAFQGMRIGNGTNTWFPTVKGASGQFGLQDGSTLNYPFEIAIGAPTDSIAIQASGLATIGLANASTAVTQSETDSSTRIATTAFVNSVILRFNLTTTSATTDNVTIAGMTAGGHCSMTPTNASGATNISTTYISAQTTNQITVTHTATAGMAYTGTCTAN